VDRSLALAVVVAVVATTATVGGATPSSVATTQPNSTATAEEPAIVAVYPNPVADDDAGEFVVLSVPPGTDLGTLTLSDDEDRVALPNVTASGQVTLSTDPDLTRKLLDRRVYPLPDSLRLANTDERLRLSRNGTVLNTLAYEDAPEGDLRVRDERRSWQPLGGTDRLVGTADGGQVTAFVLPDAPDVPIDHLQSADRRILLAGYTFTSGRVTDALVGATRHNVTVRVLIEGRPVGGMSQRQARALDRLARAGADVRVLGGDRARYRFHHAKYAIVDDSALVTTENWKPAGVGGNASRGWGVVTEQRRVVAGLVETFRADAAWHDARSWQTVRGNREFVDTEPSTASYPARFDPTRVPVERTRLLVAPDNAGPELRAVVGNATESLAIEQVTLGGRDHPLVRETLDAARRGVRVRVLLSGAWYVREDNERLVAWLNERADTENLPLEARIADPGGRFEKIHAKGAVVDGERVVLGSLNWHGEAADRNREVVLVLEGDEIGAYYRRVFEADWQGGTRRLPLGMLAIVVGVAVAALIGARSIRFD